MFKATEVASGKDKIQPPRFMTPKSKKLLCLFHEYTVPLRGRRPEPPSKAPCSWGKCRGSPKSSPTCSCPSHPALCHLAPDVTVNHAYHILGFQGQHVPALPPGNATPQSLPSPTSDQMATIPLGFSVRPPRDGRPGPRPEKPHSYMPPNFICPTPGEGAGQGGSASVTGQQKETSTSALHH